MRRLLPVMLAWCALSAVAPAFVLKGIDGKPHRLSDFSGKVLIVNFCARWYVSCREELLSMNRATKKTLQDSVTWLAVNVGEDRQAVAGFLADFPVDFTVLLDRGGQVSQSWRVAVMPTTFVIDQRGRRVHKIVGKREWDDSQHLRTLVELVDKASADF